MNHSRQRKILLLLHSLSASGATKVALDAFEFFQEQISLHTLALEGGALEEMELLECRATEEGGES